MARRDIEIDRHGGKETVNAAVYGAFGVHDGQWSGYTVTHIPTGRAVTFGAPTEVQGLRLARMLTRSGVRWSFTNADRIPRKVVRVGKAVVERWKQQWSTAR